jgi:hypothetical protein
VRLNIALILRPVTEHEHGQIHADGRSHDVCVVRYYHVLLASVRGERAPQLSPSLLGATGTRGSPSSTVSGPGDSSWGPTALRVPSTQALRTGGWLQRAAEHVHLAHICFHLFNAGD